VTAFFPAASAPSAAVLDLLQHPGHIARVQGISVGHHTDSRRPTGCSVVLCPQGAVGGWMCAAPPRHRETDLLAPSNLVQQVHGITLAGGSAWGLDAASGTVRWLEAQGAGLDIGVGRIPLVPAAVLFDVMLGDMTIRPDAAAGYAACQAATCERPAEGSVGAGAGAVVGKIFGLARAMKGGIGTASFTVDGVTVGAWWRAMRWAMSTTRPPASCWPVHARPMAPLCCAPAMPCCAATAHRPFWPAATPPSAWWPPMPRSPSPRPSAWPPWPTTAWPAPSTRCTP
jgi:hypothetical protein